MGGAILPVKIINIEHSCIHDCLDSPKKHPSPEQPQVASCYEYNHPQVQFLSHLMLSLSVILTVLRMIPMRFLSKMGTYKIQIHGHTIHVRVADCAALVVTGLAEFIPHIQTTPVGLAVKFHNNGHNNNHQCYNFVSELVA